MSDLHEPYSAEPSHYKDSSAFPRPRRRLWRTLLKWPRPVRHFAPRRQFEPSAQSEDDTRFVAQWGEHILIEDYLVVFHRDGTTSAVRHLVTQLYSRESLIAWDDLFRNFDMRTQNIKVLKAKLYPPDGKARAARMVTHRVAAPDKRANLYGRSIQVNYAPLRPGVIVEFEEQYDEYKPGEFWPALWGHYFLQTGPPCRYRRHTVAVAQPFALSYHTHNGAPPPQESHHKDYRVCTWEVNDVPGVEFDEWTPPLRDFAPWVDVSTANTWAPFAQKLKEELLPERDYSYEVRQLAKELSTGKSDPIDQATAAYTYAARTVRYGRPRREMEIRNARGSNQVFQDLQGDCKDKSALLVQLLRAMGMKANVAVLLTGDEGRAPFLPSCRFNHAVVRTTIGEQVYWLDAASGEFAFGDLPTIDQDLYALVLGEKSFLFEHVPPYDSSKHLEYREHTGKLSADGTYSGMFRVEFAGELGARLRSQFVDRTTEHRTKVLQAWLGSDYPGAVGSNFSFETVDQLSGRASYKCDAKIGQIARQIKNIVLLQIPWAGKLAMHGPLASEQRLQPMLLPPSNLSFERHVIKLPDDISPFAIPEAVNVHCDWGEYSCSWKAEGSHLTCQRVLRYGGKQVPCHRFAEFKEFWRQGSLADTTPIVLRVVT